jgi:hypothetical protein
MKTGSQPSCRIKVRKQNGVFQAFMSAADAGNRIF